MWSKKNKEICQVHTGYLGSNLSFYFSGRKGKDFSIMSFSCTYSFLFGRSKGVQKLSIKITVQSTYNYFQGDCCEYILQCLCSKVYFVEVVATFRLCERMLPRLHVGVYFFR